MSSLSPRLEIDLDQIQKNYLFAVSQAHGVEISAVLKANAYGLGAVPIAEALCEVGCKTFWAARTSEAQTIRSVSRDSDIYVLGGPEVELFDVYRKLRLRPVINTLRQLKTWCAFSKRYPVEPAALHVETGFNRLALRGEGLREAKKLYEEGCLKLSFIMSHLAFVDIPGHPQNYEQLQRFLEIRKMFPDLRASLGASYALFEKEPAFRCDQFRVGKILYGIPEPGKRTFVTKPVVLLSAPVVQVKTVNRGEFIGYDATFITTKPCRIATLAIGYADGIPRSMQEKGRIYFTHGQQVHSAPLTGRISMDLLSCDVTDIPETCVFEGAWGYVIDKTYDVTHYTETCGIMGYEAMTHFNERVERVYVRK